MSKQTGEYDEVSFSYELRTDKTQSDPIELYLYKMDSKRHPNDPANETEEIYDEDLKADIMGEVLELIYEL